MALPSTTRIPRALARDEAYERLKAWIIDGRLAAGEVLRDYEIAQALGVSRTPVREALRRLQDEGFVETALNRWTKVAPLDVLRAIETYGVIEALEVFALENAELSPRDLGEMSEANHQMQRALLRRQPALTLRYDEKFHRVWLTRAGNGELWILADRLKTKLRRVELAYWDRAACTIQSVHEHEKLLQALRKRSRSEAVAALRVNWKRARERLGTVSQN